MRGPIDVLFAFKIFSLPVPTRPGTRTFWQVPDPSRPEVKNPYPSDPVYHSFDNEQTRIRKTPNCGNTSILNLICFLSTCRSKSFINMREVRCFLDFFGKKGFTDLGLPSSTFGKKSAFQFLTPSLLKVIQRKTKDNLTKNIVTTAN